jgi:ribosomal protein S18 acetylase RimI-like enzyme
VLKVVVVYETEVEAFASLAGEIFPEYARVPISSWLRYATFWIVIDGSRAGVFAFAKHVDIDDATGSPLMRRGCFHVTVEGLLPEWRGRGFGKQMKDWQIAYAREKGFSQIVLNCRESNRAALRLNNRFGFRKRAVIDYYYGDPIESSIILEYAVGGGAGE